MSKAKAAATPPTTKVAELYGLPTFLPANWKGVVAGQECPFLSRKCRKNRKSQPEVTIGTSTMIYGRQSLPTMICPFRLLERSQIFTDCIHLLKLHEPGNELRIVGELAVPGGSIDYCLVSVRDGKPRDFVGIERQTMDTTLFLPLEASFRNQLARILIVPIEQHDRLQRNAIRENLLTLDAVLERRRSHNPRGIERVLLRSWVDSSTVRDQFREGAARGRGPGLGFGGGNPPVR